MTPNADQIARAVINVAAVYKVDPEEMFTNRSTGPAAKGLSGARKTVCLALNGAWGRTPEWWAVRLRFSTNGTAARTYIKLGRSAGCHRGIPFEEARKALPGLPAGDRAPDADHQKRIAEAEQRCEETAKAAREEIKASPASPRAVPKAGPAAKKVAPPRKSKALDESSACAALLKSTPKTRFVPSPADANGRAAGSRSASTTQAKETRHGSTVKVRRKSDVEALRKSIMSRPTPSAPKAEAIPSVTPLETAFMGPSDRRVVERCVRLQKAGSGLNDIRQDLIREMRVRKSLDWIARACVTVLKDDVA